MSDSDQLNARPVRAIRDDRQSWPESEDGSGHAETRPIPMLWRVFAANAAVFAIAFAALALSPVTISSPIRLVELVILLVGLAVMLLVDLLLLRQVLAPIHRLVRTMEGIDRLHPGQRAVGFDRASTETVALAQAFNEMLDRLETERRESSARVLAAQEAERLRIARELHDEIGQTLTAVALRAEHAAGQGGRGPPGARRASRGRPAESAGRPTHLARASPGGARRAGAGQRADRPLLACQRAERPADPPPARRRVAGALARRRARDLPGRAGGVDQRDAALKGDGGDGVVVAR